MRKELFLRFLESLPGMFPLIAGILCLILALWDDYGFGMQFLGVSGGIVLICFGIGTIVEGLRGHHQFFRRTPLPGPKVILDDDGVHFTGEDR